ncbi:MAG: hypothetical protein DDT33_01685 [Firmicutes bacterium]|nr:hypothetical protein [Bacillota bacterium]
MFVPVVDSNQRPLMPTKPQKAAKWIKSGKATPFWKKGVFCVRLNVEPSSRELQPISVGIDPGSKKEAYTVKSESHTYLNVQADAVTHVSKAVETRRNMRKARRFRKTPCRQNRKNRARGGIPPSTKARWQWKLRICNWLAKLYPIECYVVEDITARTKGKWRWDISFSPLEVGKTWFYEELGKLGDVETRQGYETKEMRDSLGLKKIGNKTAAAFEAHCVDSWVLANWWVGGHAVPDNKSILCIIPLRFYRRQLHKLQPGKSGIRIRQGSTNSLGFKRGSLVKHLKWGLCYIGGFMKDRISLHSIETGKRLCRNAKPKDCKFLTYSSWRCRNLSVA